MKTAYLVYRKTNDFDSYPFAILHHINDVDVLVKYDDVGYVELPYEEAKRIYNNKLEVSKHVKGMNL